MLAGLAVMEGKRYAMAGGHPGQSSSLSRRSFLSVLLSFAVGSALTEVATAFTIFGFGRKKAAPAELTVNEFIAISAILTGFSPEELNRDLAATYLGALTGRSGEFSLRDLYELAGFGSRVPPRGIADVERLGVFASEPSKALAEEVIYVWYSGTYTGPTGEAVVASHDAALAWKAIPWTTPTTYCSGALGSWAEAPGGVSQ